MNINIFIWQILRLGRLWFMRAFSYCAQQSNHANISINLKRKDGRQTDCSNNCYKNWNWNHLLSLFVCFCPQSPFLRSARCSVTAQSFYVRARDVEKTRCDWSFYGQTGLTWDLQTIPYEWSELFKCFPFMVTFTPATWSTNNSLRLVRIISNLCPYMARLTPYVFNGLTTHSRKPQWKMHKLAFFFIYYKTFINH